MESVVFVDSSVLIDYFRKTNKEQSFFYKIVERFECIMASVIVHFEIQTGAYKQEQINFWNNIFQDIVIVPYTMSINEQAILTFKHLKKVSLNIEFSDLAIGVTALHHNFPLATLNEKHFSRIDRLQLITPGFFL